MKMEADAWSSRNANSRHNDRRRYNSTENTITPVTSRMLNELNSSNNRFYADREQRVEINSVTMVGQILRVAEFAQIVSFQLFDDQGYLACKLFMPSSNAQASASLVASRKALVELVHHLPPSSYVRVLGHMKEDQQSLYLVITHIAQIVDFNEITFHSAAVLIFQLQHNLVSGSSRVPDAATMKSQSQAKVQAQISNYMQPVKASHTSQQQQEQKASYDFNSTWNSNSTSSSPQTQAEIRKDAGQSSADAEQMRKIIEIIRAHPGSSPSGCGVPITVIACLSKLSYSEAIQRIEQLIDSFAIYTCSPGNYKLC